MAAWALMQNQTHKRSAKKTDEVILAWKKEEKKKEWSGNCGNKKENIKRKKKEIEKYKPEKFSFTINSNHKEQIRII